MMNKIPILVSMGLVALLSCMPASAKEYTNERALRDLTAVKVYYDVNTGVPKQLLIRLRLINETYDQLVKAGVKPEFIVGFRSAASNYVTKGEEDYVFEDDEIAAKKKVHEWVKRFKAKGIRMEQCVVAARLFEIEPEDFLPEIELVGNGYISMIGYQAKGYSQVPMD